MNLFRVLINEKFWLGIFIYLMIVIILCGAVVFFLEYLTSITRLNNTPLSIAAGMILGSLLTYLLRLFWPSMYKYQIEILETKVGASWYSHTLGSVIIFFILVGLLIYLTEDPRLNLIGSLAIIVGVAGAIASLGGLIYAGYSINQFRRQILSFEDFSESYIKLLKEVENESKTGNRLRVLAKTPIPGSLALSDDRYKRLRDTIVTDGARVELCCLNDSEILDWFKMFEGKRYRDGNINMEKINHAANDVKKLINYIEEPAKSADREWANRFPPIRLKKDELPNFYLFFTDNRAIVTIPLFFPIDTDDDELKSRVSSRSVEMIGFETTDQGVIAMLRTYFENYRANQIK